MVHNRLTRQLTRSSNNYRPLYTQRALKAQKPNPGAMIIFLTFDVMLLLPFAKRPQPLPPLQLTTQLILPPSTTRIISLFPSIQPLCESSSSIYHIRAKSNDLVTCHGSGDQNSDIIFCRIKNEWVVSFAKRHRYRSIYKKHKLIPVIQLMIFKKICPYDEIISSYSSADSPPVQLSAH
jgi:hypothetical protein